MILITGATGFVGRTLCAELIGNKLRVKGTILAGEHPTALPENVEPVLIDPIDHHTNWQNALLNVETIVHLAARVHVVRETAADPLVEFRTTNTYGTLHLARQAAIAGVKRFVFMSTIGVNGDNSEQKPFTEADDPHPHNSYSVSKYEAEQALLEIYSKSGMQVVIVRAPLVYGPGNPGNFLSLLHIISKAIPLPLLSIQNSRSLIYVGNLVDALSTCALHSAAAGQTFLVSDCDDVSTPELIRRTASALHVPARLFPVPLSLMRLAGTLTGKSTAVNRLTGSLTVDSSRIQRELGWTPPFTMEEGLRETAKWYLKSHGEKR
jgi:UDP-N-acetyl-alpha-D-quinovosamine dehydrogenase